MYKIDNKLEQLDEKYFSDILYILLKKDRGIFKEFKNLFVERVYQEKKEYRLENSVVMREYPLNIRKKNYSAHTGFIDLLFLDLDKDDDVVIGIENKFLTEDSTGQIDNYKESMNFLYQGFSPKIVYLTLDGRPPHKTQDYTDVVCLSWYEDILKMLLKLIITKDEAKEIEDNLSSDMLISYWSNGNTKYNIDKDISKLIKTLIHIKRVKNDTLPTKDKTKKLLSTSDAEIISKYIKALLKQNRSKTRTFVVRFSGTYYSLEYESIKVFIPVRLKFSQAKHMINQFIVVILNTKEIEELENYDYIQLRECFKAKNDRIKNNIVNYLDFDKKIKDCKNG
jgi:hypothetical protein